ncbi:hypothetical protein [Rubritalea marina]|uniref:hypothetical protein n=1 Tax=Rubritalea marina TaxID=361055 RepID=UPI0003AA8B24|nr:hypothetical protein [Rubritalea marina]
MAATQREKRLMVAVGVLVAILAHVWVAQAIMQSYAKKKSTISSLESRIGQYKNSDNVKKVIADEMQWVADHEPEPIDFEQQQSQLLEFLSNSAADQSIVPTKPELSPQKDLGGKFQRCKIQLEAEAGESQLYRWLVKVHKPSEFRAVTSIKLKADPKDRASGLLTCTLGTEQWLIDIE